MADAPEVVPGSWSGEHLGQHSSTQSPQSTLISSPNTNNGAADGSPTKNTTNSPSKIGADAEGLQAVNNEDISPKMTRETNKPENEDANPKFGYVHDDRAGSGMEPAATQEESPTAVEEPAPQYAKAIDRDGSPTKYGSRAVESDTRDHQPPTESWHFGFWDCFSSPGLCLESFFCPCVLTGRTHIRLHEPDNTHFPSTNMYCAGCCGLTWVTLGIVPLFCFMTSAQRREIRYRYHIKGNNGEDCVKATFCVCCALVQEEKEVVWREERRRVAVSTEQLGRREDSMQYLGGKAG